MKLLAIRRGFAEKFLVTLAVIFLAGCYRDVVWKAQDELISAVVSDISEPEMNAKIMQIMVPFESGKDFGHVLAGAGFTTEPTVRNGCDEYYWIIEDDATTRRAKLRPISITVRRCLKLPIGQRLFVETKKPMQAST